MLLILHTGRLWHADRVLKPLKEFAFHQLTQAVHHLQTTHTRIGTLTLPPQNPIPAFPMVPADRATTATGPSSRPRDWGWSRRVPEMLQDLGEIGGTHRAGWGSRTRPERATSGAEGRRFETSGDGPVSCRRSGNYNSR